MKKYIIILIILVAIFITSMLYSYKAYEQNIQNLKSYNNEFEQYQNREFEGTYIATILNKAIHNNEQNKVEKDQNNIYKENETDSIKIDIYIKDNDTTYEMETIYNMGVEKFINSFSLETFKIAKIEYHEKTKRIKYIRIEQQ